MPEQSDLQAELADAWQDFLKSVNDFTEAVKACKAEGMNQAQILGYVTEGIPEEDQALYAQFYPMLSMLIASI